MEPNTRIYSKDTSTSSADQVSFCRTPIDPEFDSSPPPNSPSTGTSWLLRTPPIHTVSPGPVTRQNDLTLWPHGALSGAMLIDMLEQLTATPRPTDWSIARWLQQHYIEPFGRVERLDGLVVANSEHIGTIRLAHQRYIEIVGGSSVQVQKLWVPGLEPTSESSGEATPEQIQEPQGRFHQQVWRASEMYYRNGVEVPRKGQCVGEWKDELGWDRVLWKAPEHEIGTQ